MRLLRALGGAVIARTELTGELTDAASAAVPAGELWRLVLRAFCGGGMAPVVARIAAVWDAPAEQIDATVNGLMNGRVTTLPAHVMAAIQQALAAPEGGSEMKHAARQPAGDVRDEDVPVEPQDQDEGDPVVHLADRRGDLSPVREWPFPCGPCGDGTGFETASARVGHLRELHLVCGECDHAPFATAGRLQRHVTQFHEAPVRGPAAKPRRRIAGTRPGAPRPLGGTAQPTPEAPAFPASARAHPRDPLQDGGEDLEMEALAVGTRHLQRLDEAAVRRVLDYWAQRFVVDLCPDLLAGRAGEQD